MPKRKHLDSFDTETTSNKSPSHSPVHTIKHEFIYADCPKCNSCHYQQHTVVSGFLLKFVDQMCPSYKLKSQSNHKSQDFRSMNLELESVSSNDLDFPNHKQSVVCSFQNPKNVLDIYDPAIKRNGLNPSDMNIGSKKNIQSDICGGKQLPKCASRSTQSQSTLGSYYYVTSDKEIMACPNMDTKASNITPNTSSKACSPCSSKIFEEICDRNFSPDYEVCKDRFKVRPYKICSSTCSSSCVPVVQGVIGTTDEEVGEDLDTICSVPTFKKCECIRYANCYICGKPLKLGSHIVNVKL